MSRLSPCSTDGPSKYLLWTKWGNKVFWSGTINATVIMEISKAPHSSYREQDYQVTSRLPGHTMVALRARTLDGAKEKADKLYAQWVTSMGLKIVE